MVGRTLVEKIWDDHVVAGDAADVVAGDAADVVAGDAAEVVAGEVGADDDSGPALLYVDLHLVHEVTSPQAFEGLRMAGRTVRRPDLTLATMDHNVPTDPAQVAGDEPLTDHMSAAQMEALRTNCDEFGITLFEMGSRNQGIVHIIGPELGITQPGMTIVCGDSHTATHGAFGALAFGIGTSEVEHVLATQTLPQAPPRTMAVEFVGGTRPPGTTAKDLALTVMRELGTAGGQGHVVEYRGEAIRDLTMEERMTVCNMSIEAGARAGLIAPDETTFAYLKDRLHAPSGDAWDQALAAWRELRTDDEATFDTVVTIDVDQIEPTVTWGTTPAQSIHIGERVPTTADAPDEQTARQYARALEYMGLEGGEDLRDVAVDVVFIGSCTNGRLSDLQEVAELVEGRRVADGVRAMVVPGSGLVKEAAEADGTAAVLREAGFEWREPGCSMCLGMNPDQLAPGERAASTSNRNFEGRQGFRGRTHLVSPAMAAGAAVTGRFVDARTMAATKGGG